MIGNVEWGWGGEVEDGLQLRVIYDKKLACMAYERHRAGRAWRIGKANSQAQEF